jgi:anthranilate synthase component 2
MIDNYDSFTFNLVHMLEGFDGVSVTVRKNDEISLDEVDQFSKIILSPGPGLPSDAGIMPSLVRRYASSKSILGVCLGHQCIGENFGASLRNLVAPLHGKSTSVTITDHAEPLFRGLPKTFHIGRYHSWVVDLKGFPHEELLITAVDDAQEIMAIRHRTLKICGLQFHPESVLTEHGRMIAENWLFHEK